MQQPLHYYLLPHQTVNFRKLAEPGHVVESHIIKQDFSNEAIFNALKYRNSLGFLGSEYEKLKVVCVPAREHSIM